MSQATVLARSPRRLMSGITIEDLALPREMRVEPSGGSCGAIVHGIDLADDLPGDVIAGLLALVCHSGVMILRGQSRLTPERQSVVTEWLGKPFFRDSGVDNMAMVGRTPVQILGSQAKDPGGKVAAADVDNGLKLGPHSDVQDYQVTPDFTILHAVEVVPSSQGGNTYWANLYRAYDELDQDTKRLVSGLQWMPASTQATAYGVGMQRAKAEVEKSGLKLDSDVRHPVVRTHPVTRRKALWVSSFTIRVTGLGDQEREQELTDRLKKHVNQDHLWYKHEWSKDDVVVWDNRSVNHWREAWNPDLRRTMHRSQAGSARPF
ncbi:MAG: TauD/TfdA family dioxygenase [Candidatus Binatus sp.]|uniref:TauD/TfdA dioxygenase family protein n=1 Tax=Candidatus Binatus sp. TaxID=2811406 RepID=UPI002718A6DD|nr:TauD/TfdA family dioxygenase [Candidatus Binatus sp.]MDO8431191.1 TauD/TfdA family dioxygenase [Candidatus Binatus sp.]